MGCRNSKLEKASKPTEAANVMKADEPNLNIQGPINQSASPALTGVRFTPGTFIKKKQSVFFDDYTYIKDLGKGAFGEVIEAFHKKTKQYRAVKMIPISHVSEREKREIFEEIEILKQLDHPNIMKIYEYYEDNTNILIVGELYTGGELLDKIIEMKSFSEKKAAEAMKQILSAVNYCHKNNIVHRDLKPQNVLLDSNTEDAILKVVDFGVSAKIEPNKQFTRATGTPLFMAPEVLNKQYDQKCDLWSCGVILYIVLSGELPFRGRTKDQIVANILACAYNFDAPVWEKISEEAKDFIKKLMMFNPAERYSAEQALQDPWILKTTQQYQDRVIEKKALDNLRAYKATKKLQEAFYFFISSYFARKDEKNEFLRVFQKLDNNGDGTLSRDELLNGFSELGKIGMELNEKEVDKLIKRADANGNGVIDYAEFVAATMNRKALLDKERLEATFQMFDKDGNGQLTLDEIKEVFNPGENNLNEEEWKKLIAEVDKNKDGKISYFEFKDLMIELAEDYNSKTKPKQAI